jgi:hypothetical protein
MLLKEASNLAPFKEIFRRFFKNVPKSEALSLISQLVLVDHSDQLVRDHVVIKLLNVLASRDSPNQVVKLFYDSFLDPILLNVGSPQVLSLLTFICTTQHLAQLLFVRGNIAQFFFRLSACEVPTQRQVIRMLQDIWMPRFV